MLTTDGGVVSGKERGREEDVKASGGDGCRQLGAEAMTRMIVKVGVGDEGVVLR